MATKIPWATETWNPLNGCSKVSAGCLHCYAEKLANRLKAMGISYYNRATDDMGRWTGQITFNPTQIDKPRQWKKPKKIFVCSMGDLFHEAVSTASLKHVFNVIEKCPQHTFILLTKRPDNALDAAQSIRFGHYFELPNIWMGVTAENQEMLNKRVRILLKIPAAKRFVSIEPMLNVINFIIDIDPLKWAGYTRWNLLTGELTNQYRESTSCIKVDRLDWVIAGCESGPGRRPMDIEWARSLKDQCVSAGVPFFFKQKYIGTKKISMPLLDDQVWDQYPET